MSGDEPGFQPISLSLPVHEYPAANAVSEPLLTACSAGPSSDQAAV